MCIHQVAITQISQKTIEALGHKTEFVVRVVLWVESLPLMAILEKVTYKYRTNETKKIPNNYLFRLYSI